jgi:hypothetical protein
MELRVSDVSITHWLGNGMDFLAHVLLLLPNVNVVQYASIVH